MKGFNIHVLTGKIACYRFTGDAFTMLFCTGQKSLVDLGIPIGASFKGFAVDEINENILNVYVHHDSFDEVNYGDTVPIKEIKMKRVEDETGNI